MKFPGKANLQKAKKWLPKAGYWGGGAGTDCK